VISMRSPYRRWVETRAVARAFAGLSLSGDAGLTAVACTSEHQGAVIKFPARLPQESSP
jgi:hypothetical protein